MLNCFIYRQTNFFPDKSAEKDTKRRQLDALLGSMSNTGLCIITATAKEKNKKKWGFYGFDPRSNNYQSEDVDCVFSA